MSLWSRISEALTALRQGESLTQVFDRLRTPPQRSVGFAIAVIALGAKMAKADGHVTRDEVTAFREVFQIAQKDEVGAAKVFNLARTDVAGYQEYARRVARMFEDDPKTLGFLMEGLFYIAMADGFYHPGENEFLEEVAQIFGLSPAEFQALKRRFVPTEELDPYSVLGVTPETPMPEIRRAFRALVRDCHPDLMMARGVPLEAIRLAEKRMAEINRAWDEISGERV